MKPFGKIKNTAIITNDITWKKYPAKPKNGEPI
jgi:hypothetical protein